MAKEVQFSLNLTVVTVYSREPEVASQVSLSLGQEKKKKDARIKVVIFSLTVNSSLTSEVVNKFMDQV